MARFWESFIFIATFTFAFHNGVTNAVTHTVATTSQFQAALRAVLPGDVIILQDNTEFNGFFRAEVSGTAQDRIVIQGTSTSVLTGWSSAFNLEASYYTLRGFTIANAKKGILIDGGNFNVLEDLTIHTIDEEGVHFRFFSSDNIVQNCEIYDTGITRPGYGEGVYIGQDYSKWASPNEPDKCDRNIVRNNRIGPCGGENIDIKEGSCCGLIEGNTFDGRGMSFVNSDDSWIDVKGSDYLIQNNTGVYSIKDGIQVRTHMPPGGVSGCRNIFRNNLFNLIGNTGGVGIYLNSQVQCDNSSQIYADNRVTTGEPLTNGWVIPV
ncbi:uncharacterized protein LOC110847331 [Folsomia candida]|uniref:uncharacterized protein LOC110847331 n=1 Tax=Folsomia candida TaxID=158441 RepID=UPI000B8F9302|nr:uncharacterized protein LOC110847331 [Folsomia candida]